MRRCEIGGDFHRCDELVDDVLKPNNVIDYLSSFNTVYFDSGRSALRAVLKRIKYKTILLPAYICESVRKCFDEDCRVIYYKIGKDLKVNWDDLLKKCNEDIDIVYVHYFNGYIGSEYDIVSFLELKQKYNFLVIEDSTHSLFSSPHTVGDYCVCSLRKWFPIADGGVLYSKMNIEICEKYSKNNWAMNRWRAMEDKKEYLEGKIGEKDGFLNVFSSTEKALDQQEIPCCISLESYETLKRISCSSLIDKRLKNYEFLAKNIKCIKTAYGGIDQVPVFFTMCIKKRDELRRFLINNNIFCPIHWPLFNELECIEEAVINNEHELSIPIDQRYGLKDMEYISQIYAEYVKRGESV